MEAGVNYLGVLLAGIGTMAVGFLWYGPVFGKIWIKEMNFTPEAMAEAKTKGMAKAYIVTFIFSLISACVLARLMIWQDAVTFSQAWSLAFWVWLGFMLPIHIGNVFWEGKSFKLFVLNALHHLVAISVVALILVLV